MNFFQHLLSSDIEQLELSEFECLETLPPDFDTSGLFAAPDPSEIKDVVFGIDGNSCAGPDGFSSLFFQHCWDFVCEDIYVAVLDFFGGAHMPRSFKATTIIFLAKNVNPLSWTDYRPISLCNVTNKIISKILTARLAHLLPLVLAPNQSGFVQGRLLCDNVLLTQEMIHHLDLCDRSPNVAFKLDMAKAYDRVQWPFLLGVLQHMGFPPQWINLISRCIKDCWFSVLVNGVPSGFFHSTRGLREGDPLSLSLFVTTRF